jgi:sugar phosphate isomerase/epimerase
MRYSPAFSASLTRRRLLTLGGAAALWGVFGRSAKAQPPGRRPTIGVNSYSVRASMTGQARSTLRRLKHIGFEEVELVGEKELDRATPMCRQLGLEVLSLHVWELFDPGAPNALHASAAETLADHAHRLGVRYVVFAGEAPREACSDLRSAHLFCDAIEQVGRLMAQRQLGFLVHPEPSVFAAVGSTSIFDQLLERTSGEYVNFEPDVFWIAHVGRDPVKELERLGNRTKIVHLKDRKKGLPIASPWDDAPLTADAFTPLGGGSLDMPGILRTALLSGVRHLVLEHDVARGDPLIDLAQDYRRLVRILDELGV